VAKVEVQVETQPEKATAEETGKEETAADPLSALYERIDALPDSEEKEMVREKLAKLLAEEDEDKAETIVKTVVEVLPDVAEITINTLINPASGVTTLVQKVAKRMAKSRKEKQAKEERAQTQLENGAEELGKVDKEKAIETLSDLAKDLGDESDSEEKGLITEALGQLEEAQKTKEKEGDSSAEGEVTEGIAEALPKAAEAATAIAEKIAEAQG
jgi:tetratricopeptide (TPR) repeat protein